MAATNCYFGESTGARIFTYTLTSLAGVAAFYPSFTTWDLTPAGEAGVIIARGLVWTIATLGGYNVALTPIIDGVEQAAIYFQSAAAGEARLEAQFPVPYRCSRVAVNAVVLALPGQIEHRNLKLVYTPVREFPSKN